ncbi:transposase [Streptomyces xiangluensis]|uniref:Transposase n=1 Tax=Streptomyces xiangluensis TaxID=2665720 RepID=A0ABV8YME7_9ACTN
MSDSALLRQSEAACVSCDVTRRGRGDVLSPAPGRRDHYELPRTRRPDRGTDTRRGGRRPQRFANAACLKAYAGSAPVTRASGKTRAVLHRKVKNQRLAAVGYVWAFSSLTKSTGARAHYDRRRATGERHTAAQRNVCNRQCHEVSAADAKSSPVLR